MKMPKKLNIVFGIILFAIAIFLMIDGQNLGDSTTGMATVFLILGIGFTANGPRILKTKRKDSEIESRSTMIK